MYSSSSKFLEFTLNLQPYSSIIGSGLVYKNDVIIEGFEHPCFTSPPENLEFHSKDQF